MLGSLLGGVLGLIGVGISLVFSIKLNKNNNDFQRLSELENEKFLLNIEKENKLFLLDKERREVELDLGKEERDKEFQLEKERRDTEFQIQKEQRDLEYDVWSKKHHTLVQLMSLRAELGSPAFNSVLNASTIIYYDSKSVIDSVKKFYEYVSIPDKDANTTNDKLVDIFIQMHKDLDIHEYVDETFLYKIFSAKPD